MGNELTVLELIIEASLLVQLVMLTLVLLSIMSWVFIFERRRTYNLAYKAFSDFEEQFWSGMDLAQLYRQVNADPNLDDGGQLIFRVGFKEFSRLRQQKVTDTEAIMAGCQRVMRVAISKETEKLNSHLAFLATVGSTSPYIGLFGTVWGIMNSFIGLASVSQVTLTTVAPGISEALIATAIGLFAAIPAVIAYNRYAARADKLLNNYETFAEEFASILYRQAYLLTTQHKQSSTAS